MNAILILEGIEDDRKDGWTTMELNKHQMDALVSLIPKLAALEAVVEAARDHIRWCDVGGATIEDALNKLDALKNIESR